jgi:uncharacterized membrane protein
MVNIYGINKSHIRFFSDAVFGVAITLLVVGIQIPQLDADASVNSEEFDDLFSTIVSYVISFIIIGVYWITYHSLFNMIAKTTDVIVWLNIIFLMFITLIPFSLRISDIYDDNFHAYAFYSLIQIGTGFMLFVIWNYTVRNHLFSDEMDITSDIKKLTYIRTIITPCVFAVSLIISLYEVDLAWLFTTILIPVSIGVRTIYRRHKDLYLRD